MKPGALEAILAAYLTDGHYNGISIGVRNIDPMIFKHLADLGLIKSVFVVRGTGNTWGFGSYFPKKLSEAALKCLEGAKKPYTKIKDEVADGLDIATLLKWIIEFEGDIYIQTWGDRLLLVISMTQYEAIGESRIDDSIGRLRLSVKDTEALIDEGMITPSKIWLDYIVDRIQGLFGRRLKYYKSYQLDLTTRKTSLAHNYYFYADCTTDVSAANILENLAIPCTWKGVTTKILSEALWAYTDREIGLKDISLIKKLINCRIDRPLKGPYNEYIIMQLPQIYPLLLNGKEERVAEKMRKLERLINYFTYERKKSFIRLLSTLTDEEMKRLQGLTKALNSLETLVKQFSKGGTPIGRLWVVVYAAH